MIPGLFVCIANQYGLAVRSPSKHLSPMRQTQKQCGIETVLNRLGRWNRLTPYCIKLPCENGITADNNHSGEWQV